MIKKILNIFCIIVLIIPYVIIPDMKVKAQTLGDVERELEQYKEDYAKQEEGKQQTEEEIEATKQNIYTTTQDITKANEEIVQLNNEISKLNEEINKKEGQIKEIMNFYQKSNGESAYLEYAFGAKSFTDFIYRMAISEQLTKYNKSLIKEYNTQIDENNKKTKELNEKKKQLKEKQEELESLLKSLNTELEGYEEEMVSIEEEIRMKEDAIQMYKDMGCTSEDDLDVCTAQKLPETTELFRPLKVGYVTQEFGYPDRDTSSLYSFHGGIDISTVDNNTPVYAAGAGLVVAVSRNQYCGKNIVYIQHKLRNGETYTTSYWHLRYVYVSEGDVVTRDTQIGVMGGAASDHDACAYGAHVHFVVATGLYLKDYYYISTFNARRINPRILVNFPSNKYSSFTDRFVKYD